MKLGGTSEGRQRGSRSWLLSTNNSATMDDAVTRTRERRSTPMYAAVRRYEGITDDAEAARLVRESFMPLLEDLSSFVAYYWVDAGEGVMASLSVFEDKAGAD